jgi:hypothetical protein
MLCDLFTNLHKKCLIQQMHASKYFYVLFTVHLGIIFINNQLDTQFFFMYVYLYSVRVSDSHVPIIRRFNCINTTAGIWLFGVQVWMSLIQTCTPSGELIVSIHLVYVTLYRWPFGVQVWMSLQTVIYTDWHIPDVVLIQLILLMMGTWLPETCRE